MDVVVSEQVFFPQNEESRKTMLDQFKVFCPSDQLLLTQKQTSSEVDALSIALKNELLESSWADISMEAAIEALAQAQTEIVKVQEQQTSRRRRIEALIKLLTSKP